MSTLSRIVLQPNEALLTDRSLTGQPVNEGYGSHASVTIVTALLAKVSVSMGCRTMRALGLFRTTAQGTEWVATFSDIDLANEELHQLVLETPGEYFLLDQISGDKVFVPN